MHSPTEIFKTSFQRRNTLYMEQGVRTADIVVSHPGGIMIVILFFTTGE